MPDPDCPPQTSAHPPGDLADSPGLEVAAGKGDVLAHRLPGPTRTARRRGTRRRARHGQEERLSPEQLGMLRAYVSIPRLGKLGRISVLRRHGFWKNTLARRVGQLLYVWWVMTSVTPVGRRDLGLIASPPATRWRSPTKPWVSCLARSGPWTSCPWSRWSRDQQACPTQDAGPVPGYEGFRATRTTDEPNGRSQRRSIHRSTRARAMRTFSATGRTRGRVAP